MADDSLLVNFQVEDRPLKPIISFKGGRWKDRLNAKKSIGRRIQKPPSRETTDGRSELAKDHQGGVNEATDIQDDILPVKRQKIAHHTSQAPHALTSKPQVISSLFTYNPVAQDHSSGARDETEIDIVPSNAPLPEGAANFVALGVNAALASHLSTSLKLRAPTAIQRAAISGLLKSDRDAFIQAETGSGKTLAYVLPIVQRLMSLMANGEKARINRKSGLFALILAPTRELAKQIDGVLNSVLQKTPWLVHATVSGGTTKNHEKARIRKGINILVATPGRIVDHIEHTGALSLGRVRWLVLDEGDRLIELGFEVDVKKIFAALDRHSGERRVESSPRESDGDKDVKAIEEKGSIVDLPTRRTTILCSATMKMEVEQLGHMSMKDSILIKVDTGSSDPGEKLHVRKQDTRPSDQASKHAESPQNEKVDQQFRAPAQLKQSYVIVPAKQRLVTLDALLKRTFCRRGTVKKAIVFVSCADSVDFHFNIFAKKEGGSDIKAPLSLNHRQRGVQHDAKLSSKSLNGVTPVEKANSRTLPSSQLGRKPSDLPTIAHSQSLSTPANPKVQIFKLHGSLPQKIRSATLSTFSRSSEPSILFCTDVASRGLDLPDIDLVIEYDPPFSSDDHLHRVGRTARAGQDGKATCFLMPGPEERYVDVLRVGAGERYVKGETGEDVLKKGFEVLNRDVGQVPKKWDERATEWQLDVERWILEDMRAAEVARKAYVSHVRAYATHIAKERGIFDVKDLQLGHLAKAFGLRETPGSLGRSQGQGNERGKKKSRTGGTRWLDKNERSKPQSGSTPDQKQEHLKMDWRQSGALMAADDNDARKRMKEKMKEHMAVAGEFNIG